MWTLFIIGYGITRCLEEDGVPTDILCYKAANKTALTEKSPYDDNLNSPRDVLKLDQKSLPTAWGTPRIRDDKSSPTLYVDGGVRQANR